MTINKLVWPIQPDSSAADRKTDRNLSASCCPMQQGIVEEGASSTIAARIVPFDDRGVPGPESQVELNSCDHREISFHHQLPLSARRAVISVEDANFGNFQAEVSLSWCRFNHMGHYTSGGRFVQPGRFVKPPGRIA
jgi:hypothetical protein